MDDKIIRELKTSEASQKNFMGLNGKIAIIAYVLGQPIMKQSDDDYGIDVRGYYDEDEMPTLGEDASVFLLGYAFDGLKWGKHIEIKCLDYDNEITVYYKGYKVYEEIAGMLEAYNSFESWENMIEELFKNAEKVGKVKMEQQKIENEKLAKKEHANFLQRIRMRWGI